MEEFRKLGLTKYETAIYVALLEHGRSDAQQIAGHSHVPPTAVYPNLKSLLEKQFIQQFEGKVALFEALPPSIAIKTYVDRKTKILEEIGKTAISRSQQTLNSKRFDVEKEVLHVTHGKEPSIAVYYDAIKKAENTFYVLGWRLEKVGNKYEFLRELSKLANKGVDVRIILHGSPNKAWDLIKAYKDAGIKLRYVPLENFSILVVDAKECKITLKEKSIPEKINMHILDKDLAKSMHSYFLTLWNQAAEINQIK